jgi:hypothetical protein
MHGHQQRAISVWHLPNDSMLQEALFLSPKKKYR